MKILVLIDRDLAISQKKNETLERLLENFTAYNVSLDIARFIDIEFFVNHNDVTVTIGGTPLSEYTMVYFRHVGKYKTIASLISHMCDKLAIPFVDTIYRHTTGTGKIDQTIRLALSQTSVPKSYYATNYTPETLKRAVSFLGSPLVLKDSGGRLGADVFLIHSIQELERTINKQETPKEWLLQEFIPNNFDYRVLTMGGKAIIVEKRERRNKKDFRNNVSLGAQEHFLTIHEAPKEILNLAEAATTSLHIEIAGVDIVTDRNTGLSYILEVNRCPGFTHEGDSGEANALAQYLFSLCQKK